MRTQVLLCAVLFITTGSVASIALPASACAQSTDDRCGCLIVSIEGKADVKPQNAAKYVPAARDMAVFMGDLVKVAESSRVRLICGEENHAHEWTGGFNGVPCKLGDKHPIWINDRVIDPRGMRGVDSAFPALLSPRKTTLLNPHPKIRWTPVANVNKYTVRVSGLNVDWTTRVDSTEVAYPDDAPALVAGQSYKIRIFAGRRSSEEEGLAGLGFTIISEKDAAEVGARAGEINKLNVEETSKRLLIASLYARHNLNAEAIMQLDEAASDQETIRMLAELYLEVLLIDSAENQYRRALDLAGANTLAKAIAHDRLGQIYEAARTKNDKAIQSYEDALNAYQDLKNWVKVSLLANKLQELQKR